MLLLKFQLNRKLLALSQQVKIGQMRGGFKDQIKILSHNLSHSIRSEHSVSTLVKQVFESTEVSEILKLANSHTPDEIKSLLSGRLALATAIIHLQSSYASNVQRFFEVMTTAMKEFGTTTTEWTMAYAKILQDSTLKDLQIASLKSEMRLLEVEFKEKLAIKDAELIWFELIQYADTTEGPNRKTEKEIAALAKKYAEVKKISGSIFVVFFTSHWKSHGCIKAECYKGQRAWVYLGLKGGYFEYTGLTGNPASRLKPRWYYGYGMEKEKLSGGRVRFTPEKQE